MTTRRIRDILVAVASGPLLAGLLLLIPLGVLTGLNVALDPSLAIDEFAPEEELVVPFLLLAALISAANVRLAWMFSQGSEAGRRFKVMTMRYKDDQCRELHPHGHRGRQLALDFQEFLVQREEEPLTLGPAVTEDYGWKFSIERPGFSALWVLVAHVEQGGDDQRDDEFIVSVAFEPPLLPWLRLLYRPDFFLQAEIERQFMEFLRANDLSFDIDFEQWMDPEPGVNSGPMF